MLEIKNLHARIARSGFAHKAFAEGFKADQRFSQRGASPWMR
jgi:hypothetical protein